jgi:7-cyano-7-deazaguanine synthase
LGVDVVKRALLLSGGLDSAAIAWWKRPDVGIFVDYGQRAAIAERRAAEAIAGACGTNFIPIAIDCSVLGSGQMSRRDQIAEAPTPEWWPFRNQLLVTMVASVALTNGIRGLMIGTVSEDATNGDGTPQFVEALGV